MRHMTSKHKAQIEAEVQARRDAAVQAAIENRRNEAQTRTRELHLWMDTNCSDCVYEEQLGITLVWLCDRHVKARGVTREVINRPRQPAPF